MRLLCTYSLDVKTQENVLYSLPALSDTGSCPVLNVLLIRQWELFFLLPVSQFDYFYYVGCVLWTIGMHAYTGQINLSFFIDGIIYRLNCYELIFISKLKNSIYSYYLIEKKVYATQMMLDKFTIRWSMLDNFITSLE